jgi:hypothetical protein
MDNGEDGGTRKEHPNMTTTSGGGNFIRLWPIYGKRTGGKEWEAGFIWRSRWEDNDFVGHNKAFFGGMRRRPPKFRLLPMKKAEQ